jgi:defect in organelle trafficking protein DotD
MFGNGWPDDRSNRALIMAVLQHDRQNMMKIAHVPLIVATLAMAACSSTSTVNMKDPQLVASPDRVSGMLAEAADKASNALQTLAAIEQAKAPAADLARTDSAPVELRRAVTVAWVGPVDALSKSLADRASYSFTILGDIPPVPVVVNIDVENKPIIDVLRDIGLQLGGRADIRVDSIRRVVELHYAPVTASTEG